MDEAKAALRDRWTSLVEERDQAIDTKTLAEDSVRAARVAIDAATHRIAEIEAAWTELFPGEPIEG